MKPHQGQSAFGDSLILFPPCLTHPGFGRATLESIQITLNLCSKIHCGYMKSETEKRCQWVPACPSFPLHTALLPDSRPDYHEPWFTTRQWKQPSRNFFTRSLLWPCSGSCTCLTFQISLQVMACSLVLMSWESWLVIFSDPTTPLSRHYFFRSSYIL